MVMIMANASVYNFKGLVRLFLVIVCTLILHVGGLWYWEGTLKNFFSTQLLFIFYTVYFAMYAEIKITALLDKRAVKGKSVSG